MIAVVVSPKLCSCHALLQSEEGSNSIEYALIAAMIAVVLITGATALGVSLGDYFNRLGACVQTPTPGCMG